MAPSRTTSADGLGTRPPREADGHEAPPSQRRIDRPVGVAPSPVVVGHGGGDVVGLVVPVVRVVVVVVVGVVAVGVVVVVVAAVVSWIHRCRWPPLPWSPWSWWSPP